MLPDHVDLFRKEHSAHRGAAASRLRAADHRATSPPISVRIGAVPAGVGAKPPIRYGGAGEA
jgi:hypothetical protein